MANTHRQGHCEDPRKQNESAASKTRQGKRWVAQGKTVSAFPPEGLFTNVEEGFAERGGVGDADAELHQSMPDAG